VQRPRPTLLAGLLAVVATSLAPLPARAGQDRLPLSAGWSLQSSAKLSEKGEALSQPGFNADGWHRVTVPNTVVGALVENGHFPDPYFGMNLRQIPGTSYPVGERFTNLPMPAPGAPSPCISTGSTTGPTSGSTACRSPTPRKWRGCSAATSST
jgi:hypothetical protein